MSFGSAPGMAGGWALDDEAAAPLFRQAVELGITCWDTANVYSAGTSEEITGRAIREYTRREDVVLATKVFFPLAKGRLARPWREQAKRSETDPMGQWYVGEENRPIVEAVARIAEARGVPMAQVALAWVLRNPVVTAPIVGPTKEHHLADAVAALDVRLSDVEAAALEEHYTVRPPSGY